MKKLIILLVTILLISTIAISLVACGEPTSTCDCPKDITSCTCSPLVEAPPLPSDFDVSFVISEISNSSYITQNSSYLSIGTWFITTFDITNNNDTGLKLDFSLRFDDIYQSKSLPQHQTHSISEVGMIIYGKFYLYSQTNTEYAIYYLTEHFYLDSGESSRVIVAFYVPPQDRKTNTLYTKDNGNFQLEIKQHDATTNTYTLLKTVPITGEFFEYNR